MIGGGYIFICQLDGRHRTIARGGGKGVGHMGLIGYGVQWYRVGEGIVGKGLQLTVCVKGR